MFKTFATIVVAAVVSLSAASASAKDDLSKIGVGPHGFDFLIGQTIVCHNSMPGPISGPATSTVSVSAGSSPGRLTFRNSNPNVSAGYDAYVSAKKTWVGPFANADGSYGSETLLKPGARNVWAGTYTSATGRTMKLRDTFTNMSFLKSIDVTETNDGSGWKVIGKTTCTGSKS